MSNNSIQKVDKFLPKKNEEVDTDFNYTRTNLYTLIETAMAGIEEFVPIAQQSQNARAYEVLFNAIKSTAELNEKLADHTIKKEKETKEEEKLPGGDTINQNLYVGTAAELQKLLKKSKDNDE